VSSQTAVVCDTTAYLPSKLTAERGIEVVSLYVAIDGDQRPESEIGDYGEFFERLRASESGFTTSQPSVGDFVGVYEPLLDADRDIVSIHISAGISGTYEAAGQARERLIAEGKGGERIRVFDSRSAAGGMGLSVLAAAAAAAAGEDGDGVLARAAKAREELKMWFAVDTLEFPPVERVRTRARALERLRSYARQRQESDADGWVVQHIQDSETAATLVDDCREIFGCEPVFVSEIGAVLGAHVGPGLLGVGSVSKSVLS
jgi:fatty acid-binding protein DegV